MVINIVKIFLGISLVLWSVWCHFQGGSLWLASSVCWSLQCLTSALTKGGGGGHFFLASLVPSRCEEEGTLQITLACAHSVSATLGLPPLMVHTPQALGCSAGNHLKPALGCMHLPGLSRSGSGTQVVLRGTGSVGPAFCALPRSKQLRWWGV